MNNVNLKKEWRFIDSERIKVLDKKSLMFELLNIAKILLLNYMNIKTEKEEKFYKIVYLKTKKFYLKRRADAKIKV